MIGKGTQKVLGSIFTVSVEQAPPIVFVRLLFDNTDDRESSIRPFIAVDIKMSGLAIETTAIDGDRRQYRTMEDRVQLWQADRVSKFYAEILGWRSAIS